jgi:EAL domain-containing protein (putative c-di-GMP-specific phosphodiesterase class I)
MNAIMVDTQIKETSSLAEQLREALYLDIDEYGLDAPVDGEYTTRFLGIKLSSVFQPVYEIASGEVYGHEALLRPLLASRQSVDPEFAFSFADQSGRLVKFDRICRTLHLLNYSRLANQQGLLFLNVHPKLLLSVNAHGEVFERILHANSVAADRVVIEINESLITQSELLQTAVENYRGRNYRIATDHFGQDQSSLNRLWKLAPDYVKLDRQLIQSAEGNARLRKGLRQLLQFIRDLDAEPIIQGIENQQQFDIALEAGGNLLQGYFLGHPAGARSLTTPTPTLTTASL